MLIEVLKKSQFVRKQALKWEQTLRDEPAPLSYFANGPSTLLRLTLNSNQLGNQGLDYLIELLSEEIGLLGLDLQDNGIREDGARLALECLKMNKEIQVLDLRNNLFGNL